MNEIPVVYRCDDRKARKNHICCECFGLIHRGEVYHSHHGVWDGRGETFKVCVDCDALRNIVDKNAHYSELTAFRHLMENVFGGDSLCAMLVYRDIAIKRQGKLYNWQISRIKNLIDDCKRSDL
jgi:hypothetical protein